MSCFFDHKNRDFISKILLQVESSWHGLLLAFELNILLTHYQDIINILLLKFCSIQSKLTTTTTTKIRAF